MSASLRTAVITTTAGGGGKVFTPLVEGFPSADPLQGVREGVLHVLQRARHGALQQYVHAHGHG